VDQPTPRPGQDSFTVALIESLKILVGEFKDGFFTTRDLEERIKMKRPTTPPALWRRLERHNRHVRLSPLKDPQQVRRESERNNLPLGFLSLQFALRDDRLSKEQIEELTRHLPKTFEQCKVAVDNILWLGFDKAGRPKTFYDAVWLYWKHQNKNRGNRTTQWHAPSGPSEISPSRKRKPSEIVPLQESVSSRKSKRLWNAPEDPESSIAD